MQLSKKNLINASEYNEQINIEVIANKLNNLLRENKVSTKALSEATGVSIAAINNLKRAEGNPTIGTLNAICNFFGVSLLEFLGLDLQNTRSSALIVPLYDLRSVNNKNEETILSKILIETPKNISNQTIFGVLLNNNSLLPFYEKGTIFILAETKDPVDNDIVLVRIQNNVNSLKRIFIKKNSFYLKNINIEESMDMYDKDDLEILGIVIQIIQKTI